MSAATGGDDGDDAAMRRVGAGDAAACRLLVERHLPRVLGLAWRLLGDRAEAEDAAQEAFLRLWRHAGDWQPGRARLGTWLHQVALNLCRDRLRRRRTEPLDSVPEPPVAPEAEAGIQRRQAAAAVRAALAALPERQRLAIELCHFQGLAQAEAAAALGIGVEALESLLARGRRGLRERLRPLAADLLEAPE